MCNFYIGVNHRVFYNASTGLEGEVASPVSLRLPLCGRQSAKSPVIWFLIVMTPGLAADNLFHGAGGN